MSDAISYLNSLGLHKIKPGLGRTIKLLELFGNSQEKIPNILIAGTNGKGSVATTIASILEIAGHNVGLYTSPHLIRLTERIKINGDEIPLDELYRLILDVKKAASNLPEDPTYFEVLTVAAFVYFAQKKTDFSVLEVGMGGRLDATNVVRPLVSVITNISLDHTEFLGRNVREIALEKGGIIKNGVPVVTAAKSDTLSVIECLANDKLAPIIIKERDFRTEGETTQDFNYIGSSWNLKHLKFGLHGFYQIENASLAIATLEFISKIYETNITEERLRKGLFSVRWEGRMEILRKNPPLILDGAHNPGAAEALRISIEKMFQGTKFVLLLGMLRDKDHEAYLNAISSIANFVIITEVPSERSIKAIELANVAKRYINNIKIISDYREAYKEAFSLQSPTCITGSLYLIGAIKQLYSSIDSF
jgi:dihydrofolate synthase/folylpolyglutamate synthase